MSDEFVEKKSIWKILLIIFIVLIILGGITFGGYTLLKKTILNPEKYLINTKEILSLNIIDNLKVSDLNNNKDSKFNGKISFKTDNKDLDYLNKLNIDYNIISSLLNEEIQTNIKYNEDNNNILEGNIYLNKDSIYLDSNDLYSKILLLNKFDYNIFEEINKINKETNDNINNIKIGFNNYFDSLINALKETKMTSEFVSIYKVKYTYEINDGNRDIIQNKYDELIKNDKTIELLIKNNIISKELFNIKFTNIKVEIIKSIGTNKIYNLDITKDNDNVFTLEMDSNDDNIYHIKSKENNGTLTIDNDTYTLKLYDNDIVSCTIKFVNNNNLLKFSITDNELDLAFSIKKENKNKMYITFSIKDKNNANLDLTMTINKIDKKYEMSSIFDLSQDGEKIRVINDGIMEIGENLLTNKDLSNAVDINSLNETEQNKISDNLYKKLEKSKLLELLSNQENSYS